MVAIIISAVFLVAPIASAQVGSSEAETINVRPASQFYEPNSTVEIEVLSRIINLNDKQITWTVNGNVVQTGFGVQNIEVPTGTAESPNTVTFKAVLPTQGNVTRTLTLRPVEVDLILESDNSYIPPFYEGKALNPGWGTVSVTAIPHVYKPGGQKYDPDSLVYQWEYNGIVYGDDSGRGEDSISIQTTPRDNSMAVEVETPDGDIVARDFINFPRTEPRIVFYEESNSLGTVFNRSLQDSDVLNKETTDGIAAFPYYYLADSSKADNLQYQWTVSGSEVREPVYSKNTLNIENIESQSTDFSLEVSDERQLLFPSYDNSIDVEIN